MITEEQGGEIERRARAIADAIPLETEDEFHAAVEAQVARITKPPLGKRRATVLALAEVGLTSPSRRQVFARPDTVSDRVFYDTKKDWYHDPEYREILLIVGRLYERWALGETTRRAAVEFAERHAALRRYEQQLGETLFHKAMEMIRTELYELTTTGEDGKDITLKPARWTFDTVPRLADAADKLLRLSLDLAPGGRQQVEVMDWREHLPEGVSVAQAEAAQAALARLLAEAAENEDDNDDE